MNVMIIAPQSFVGKHHEQMLDIIPYLGDRKVFLFKDQGVMCAISDRRCKENYDTVMQKLAENGVEPIELPVYGFDELFYFLRSPQFCRDYFGKTFVGEEDILEVSPTNANYVIGTSASIFDFCGTLKLFRSRVRNNLQFSVFDYKTLFADPKWIDIGLDKKRIDRRCASNDYYYELDGKTYQGTLPAPQRNAAGNTAYTFRDSNGLRVKIWFDDIDIRQYYIDKIESMMELRGPDYISFPLALVYNGNNVPIGCVMKDFSGSFIDYKDFSTKLKNPYKSIQAIMRNMVCAELFCLIHSDFYHNMLFNGDDCYMIDVETCQFSIYPPTSFSCEINNGIPAPYCKFGKDYYSTTILSYWAAYMSASAVIPIENDITSLCVYTESPDFFGLNHYMLADIGAKAPALEEALRLQYYQIIPLHPMRYYMMMDALMHSRRADPAQGLQPYIDEIGIDKSSLKPIGEIPAPTPVPPVVPLTPVITGETDDPADDDNEEVKVYAPSDDSESDMDVPAEEEPVAKKPSQTGQRNKPTVHKVSKEQNNVIEGQETADKPTFAKVAKESYTLLERLQILWRHLIVKLFGKQIRTINSPDELPDSSLSDEKRQQIIEKQVYKSIIKKKLWVTPTIVAVSSVLLAIILIIVAVHL